MNSASNLRAPVSEYVALMCSPMAAGPPTNSRQPPRCQSRNLTMRSTYVIVARHKLDPGEQTDVQYVDVEPSPRSRASFRGTPPVAETSSRYFLLNNAPGKNPGSSCATTAGLTSIPARSSFIFLPTPYSSEGIHMSAR